ncbi:CU044_2847 family protein [Actinomadura fulvescens]|uniref:Trypsin-co-occurring domain-containing protein n=1 Tax=Actinomadura fulvescens TaxID=46160 RepID=A0ABP6CRM3_9ACTN
MATQVVKYQVDDSTVVRFEIDPPPGWQPVGADQLIGHVQQAVEPAVIAARAVLHKIREVGPDRVEVKFGIKVSGKMDWLVAKTAAESNFEITLTWEPEEPGRS